MRFELGEGHFDGIEIGAVGREEQEPRPALLEDRCGFLALVAGEVVEDDHVAGLQRRRELGLDIGLEDLAVHRAVDHPRCGQSVMTQGGDEGLGAPMAEGRLHLQPLSPTCPASEPGHLGGRSSFVDKHQPLWAPLHPRLAVHRPYPALSNDVSAIGFARQQRFF